MPLIALPPKTPTADINLEKLMQEMSNEPDVRRLRRTLPAEWAAQSGVQLTWPHAGTDWNYMLEEVTETYIRMAYEIAVREPLLIVTPEPGAVRALLAKRFPGTVIDNVRFFECPTNDTWARDHGFLTVLGTNGAELLDFRFNGWGGKFEATFDNEINRHLAEAGDVFTGKYVDCLDFELEGGAIESDGLGTILTTAECLLNENRRREGDIVPEVNKSQVEMILRDRFGAERFLWLNHGFLAGDDTDSHIDTLARLCSPSVIAYVKCDDKEDMHYEALKAMEEELQSFRTADNQPYTLIPLPMADACYDEDGERLPATYANFLIMNEAVLLPVYNQPYNDERAVKQLQKAFPHHEIVTVDCRSLIRQHGSLHCCTMQFPRGVM